MLCHQHWTIYDHSVPTLTQALLLPNDILHLLAFFSMEEPNIINLGRLGIKFSLFLLQYKSHGSLYSSGALVPCLSMMVMIFTLQCSWGNEMRHAFIFHFSGNSRSMETAPSKSTPSIRYQT